MKKITGINIDIFLNRLLYSLYNLIYFFGLPIYAAVELLMQRPLYCLPFWKCGYVMHAIPSQVPCVLLSRNWTKDMPLSLLVTLDVFEIRRFSSTSVPKILCEIDSSISCK